MTNRITIDGRTIEISNPAKLLFPGDGITKAEIVDYYQRIAARMLPHIRGRPVTMVRYPDGILSGGFFQKEISDYFPEWIGRVKVTKEGGSVTHPLCDTAAGLVYLANQATVTLHVWLSRVGRLHNPDIMVFDMDPAAEDFAAARAAARRARDLLEELALTPYIQTTGSRGLHVVVPLDGAADFRTVRAFCRDVARLLADRGPDTLTTEQRKAKRMRRLFLDTGRNAYAQTFAAPYTVRAKPGAPVAAPLDWSELGKGDSQRYNIRNIFRRLGRKDDPWEGMWRDTRGLAEARKRLNGILRASPARSLDGESSGRRATPVAMRGRRAGRRGRDGRRAE